MMLPRTLIAGVLVIVVAAILWTWFWTLPQCLSSGWGTPGYSRSQRSVTDDHGPLGCWFAEMAKERLNQQEFDDWVRASLHRDRERRR